MSDSETNSQDGEVEAVKIPCMSGQPSCAGAILRGIWPKLGASGKNLPAQAVPDNSLRADAAGDGAPPQLSPDLAKEAAKEAETEPEVAKDPAKDLPKEEHHHPGNSPLKRVLSRMKDRASSPFAMAAELTHRISSNGRDKSRRRAASLPQSGERSRSAPRVAV